MGNRAEIIIKERAKDLTGVQIYLHWSGEPESVLAFVDYTLRHVRRDEYFTARLLQVIGNFRGGSLSLGLREWSEEKGCYFGRTDNGIYTIVLESNDHPLTDHNISEFCHEDIRKESDYAEVLGGVEKANDPFFEEAIAA